MAIKNIKNKKSTFMGDQGELTRISDFERYVEKYGEEKAIAYLHAMNDFNLQLETIIGGGFVGGGRTNSDSEIRKQIIELQSHNFDFLKFYVDRIHSTKPVKSDHPVL